MKRYGSSLLALLLVLGFLVGDSFTDREPGDRSTVASTPATWVWQTPSLRVPSFRALRTDTGLPTHIRIPALDIAGDILPVGMSDESTMQVPDDIKVVGWFDGSVPPLSAMGNTVFVGHRDGVHDPNGVFRRLGDARVGDSIKVRNEAGKRIDYTITSVDVLGRREFARQAPRLFQTTGLHRLILITCGGEFDEQQGGYQANVVVEAERT